MEQCDGIFDGLRLVGAVRRKEQLTCVHMRVDMRVDMCLGMCVGMCVDMCLDKCMDMRVDMCVDICLDMCVNVCKDMCCSHVLFCAKTNFGCADILVIPTTLKPFPQPFNHPPTL